MTIARIHAVLYFNTNQKRIHSMPGDAVGLILSIGTSQLQLAYTNTTTT